MRKREVKWMWMVEEEICVEVLLQCGQNDEFRDQDGLLLDLLQLLEELSFYWLFEQMQCFQLIESCFIVDEAFESLIDLVDLLIKANISLSSPLQLLPHICLQLIYLLVELVFFDKQKQSFLLEMIANLKGKSLQLLKVDVVVLFLGAKQKSVLKDQSFVELGKCHFLEQRKALLQRGQVVSAMPSVLQTGELEGFIAIKAEQPSFELTHFISYRFPRIIAHVQLAMNLQTNRTSIRLILIHCLLSALLTDIMSARYFYICIMTQLQC